MDTPGLDPFLSFGSIALTEYLPIATPPPFCTLLSTPMATLSMPVASLFMPITVAPATPDACAPITVVVAPVALL